MTPAWEEGLRNSAVFLCLVTKHYLRKPECWEQMALARQLQKPCIAVIKHGTPVPRGFPQSHCWSDQCRIWPDDAGGWRCRLIRHRFLLALWGLVLYGAYIALMLTIL
jgi:hypothetical protein